MLSNVPQFIDVEDKVAGPLTAKQIFWLLGMGAVLFLVWTFFDAAAFFVVAVPVILIFSLFAFYRPYNQSLLSFTINSILFLFRPKIHTWERPVSLSKHLLEPLSSQKSEENIPQATPEKKLTPETIRELASVIDKK